LAVLCFGFFVLVFVIGQKNIKLDSMGCWLSVVSKFMFV